MLPDDDGKLEPFAVWYDNLRRATQEAFDHLLGKKLLQARVVDGSLYLILDDNSAVVISDRSGKCCANRNLEIVQSPKEGEGFYDATIQGVFTQEATHTGVGTTHRESVTRTELHVRTSAGVLICLLHVGVCRKAWLNAHVVRA